MPLTRRMFFASLPAVAICGGSAVRAQPSLMAVGNPSGSYIVFSGSITQAQIAEAIRRAANREFSRMKMRMYGELLDYAKKAKYELPET